MLTQKISCVFFPRFHVNPWGKKHSSTFRKLPQMVKMIAQMARNCILTQNHDERQREMSPVGCSPHASKMNYPNFGVNFLSLFVISKMQDFRYQAASSAWTEVYAVCRAS